MSMTSAALLACLTSAVYFESKGEPPKGQAAVAHVVLNRAKQKNKNAC